MQHVSEFTAPLAGQGERVVGDALKTLNDLDALLLDLRQVAGRVNNSQGTVGKLLDDDRLYYSLINTLQNVELLTQRLEPIVHDVRVFTDKAARGGPSSFIDIRGRRTRRAESCWLEIVNPRALRLIPYRWTVATTRKDTAFRNSVPGR